MARAIIYRTVAIGDDVFLAIPAEALVAIGAGIGAYPASSILTNNGRIQRGPCLRRIGKIRRHILRYLQIVLKCNRSGPVINSVYLWRVQTQQEHGRVED